MGSKWKERWHGIKERVLHPLAPHGHGEEEEARGAGGKVVDERRKGEHKVDEVAGSEYLGD